MAESPRRKRLKKRPNVPHRRKNRPLNKRSTYLHLSLDLMTFISLMCFYFHLIDLTCCADLSEIVSTLLFKFSVLFLILRYCFHLRSKSSWSKRSVLSGLILMMTIVMLICHSMYWRLFQVACYALSLMLVCWVYCLNCNI